MNEKEKSVVEYFLAHPEAFIGEISEATEIPRSSVQRYLNKHKDLVINDALGITIGQQLTVNQHRGKVQGGRTSFLHNSPVKDEMGHFVGNVRDVDYSREDKKRKDIKLICTYYLSNKTFTLDELADSFKELFGYSRDYIYDCLLDSRVPSVMGEESAREIEQTLENNYAGFYRKVADLHLTEADLQQADFTDREREVFSERSQNPTMTLSSMSEKYGVSKTALAKIENRAIGKVRKVIGRGKSDR